MPSRALKACARSGCGGLTAARFCESCVKAGHAPSVAPFAPRSSEPRLTTTQRGYGASWRKLRDWILSKEPCCRPCRQAGRTRLAAAVDHILPKADGGSDDESNLQPICDECHRMKTAREDSGPAALIPGWLKPSLTELTIICGAPASGKSTFAKQHMSSQDEVIDLDEIIETLSERHRYHWGRSNWISRALRYRNNALGALSKDKFKNAVWLIVGAPSPSERSRWSELLQPSKGIVVLETPAVTCIDRIRRDESRKHVAQGQIDAVWRWWTVYSSRPGERTVRSAIGGS